MRKSIASLLLFISVFLYAQDPPINDLEVLKDTVVYNKDTNISEERTFSPDLKKKYSDKDFQYKEEKTTVKKERSAPTNSGFLQFFALFMSNIFPFLLGGFIIFIILKAFIGFDVRFWKPIKATKRTSVKLIYVDEDIHELDLDVLLQKAIKNNDFRLAIRYYYLTSLKGLSNNKLIEYHKDKTNSEYVFEIENTAIRNQFSYLSYVYTYVWYGEFPVDEQNFKAAQNKYQSFINTIL